MHLSADLEFAYPQCLGIFDWKKNPIYLQLPINVKNVISYELLAWPPVNHFLIFLGWGDGITWVQTYEEGLYQAKKR